MNGSNALRGLADLSSALVTHQDLTGVLALGLAEATRAVGADAGGVLVTTTHGSELLSSTSHRAADLEAYQAGAEEGPCIDAMRLGEVVAVHSLPDVVERWPAFVPRMREAGYQRMCAVPMRWHGQTLGGLNVFWAAGGFDEDAVAVLQTFADILTVAIINVHPLDPTLAARRVHEALEGRARVEQAKGWLSERHQVSMDRAYDRLVAIAADQGLTLGQAAHDIIQGPARR